MIVVIADDITGAAEMAGIAFQRGLNVHFALQSVETFSVCDVLVIATDTRSMIEQEAVDDTRRVLSRLMSHFYEGGTNRVGEYILFKKTDSALRGHIMAELTSLMEATHYRQALFLPANPSRGRRVIHGRYEIDGRPIHETDFSFDPEFPATTSVMSERFPDADARHIIIPDVSSMEDVHMTANLYSPSETLFAGAADLFSAFLDIVSPDTIPMSSHHVFHIRGSILMIAGSTQSKSLSTDIPVSAMPLEVYDGMAANQLWIARANHLYSDEKGLMLTIPHHHLTGREVAVRLRNAQATVVKEIVKNHRPQYLVIEGGATAFACLQALGWTRFQVSAVIAPGVVAMRSETGTTVIMKPGSYPWGQLFTPCE